METPSPTRGPRPSPLALLAAFAAVYVIWGSTYLAIRLGVETLPPFTMAGLRFLIAGALLYGWSAARGAARPTPVQWRSALVIGGLLLVSGNGLLTWAEVVVPSGVAALIVATVPLWMVVLESLRRGGARPSGSAWVGLALGLVGIGLLVGPQGLEGAVDPVGGAAICLAAFSWALGSIYSRSAPQTDSTFQNVGMQMLLGGALLVALGFGLGERIDPSQVSARSAWALAYLSIVGGIVSYSAYVWLLRVSTPAKVSTYAYVNPIVAVLLGWGVAGEAVGPRVFLAMLAVVAAVVLITLRRAPRAPAALAEEPA